MPRPRRPRRDGPPLHRHPPAEVIRRVVATGHLPVAHVLYRKNMAVVDAVVFSHPDYGALTHLAAAIETETKGHRP